MELNSRFGDLASQSIQGLKCIPSHATDPMEQETVEEMLKYYKEDLHSRIHFTRRSNFGSTCGVS